MIRLPVTHTPKTSLPSPYVIFLFQCGWGVHLGSILNQIIFKRRTITARVFTWAFCHWPSTTQIPCVAPHNLYNAGNDRQPAAYKGPG